MVTLPGRLWFTAVATATLVGVSFAARFQRLMTAIEVLSLRTLAIGAIVKVSISIDATGSHGCFSKRGSDRDRHYTYESTAERLMERV